MSALQLFRAIVTDTQDPLQQSRLKIQSLQAVSKAAPMQYWARVLSTPGQLGQPGYAIGDEVIVAAEDLAADPVVMGCVTRAQVAQQPAHALQILPDAKGLTIQVGSTTSIKVGHDGVVDIWSSNRLTISAPSLTVQGDTITLETAICRISGTVQCDTLIANSVVSAAYSSGAGNIS